MISDLSLYNISLNTTSYIYKNNKLTHYLQVLPFHPTTKTMILIENIINITLCDPTENMFLLKTVLL